MQSWNYLETRHIDNFDIAIDWAYDPTPIQDAFIDTDFKIQQMIERCDSGIDTHYLIRVRVYYQGLELASDHLGSQYAMNCSPSQHVTNDSDKWIEDLIETCLDQAKSKITNLQKKLTEDFC